MNYTKDFYYHIKIGIEEVDFNEQPNSADELFDLAFEYALEQMDNIHGYYSGWRDKLTIEGSVEEQESLRLLAIQVFETM